eukprot:scaffold143654_cov20-Tisochrysis_lutea.AAC.1
MENPPAGAPYHEHPDLSLAYLVVEATGPVKAEGGPGGQQGREPGTPRSHQQAPQEDARPGGPNLSLGQQRDGYQAGDGEGGMYSRQH